MLPVDHVNDLAVISQHPNFVSINAALEVDFYGQVCRKPWAHGTFPGPADLCGRETKSYYLKRGHRNERSLHR
ncbi:MAG: acetyl-CoA hydrolase/transferase C-terminal domain-containing protein [Oscillospiraceae bacterium]